LKIDAGEISAGVAKAFDETDLHWVGPLHKNNRYCFSCRFCREGTVCAPTDVRFTPKADFRRDDWDVC
jgi:hypothetical protein